MQLISPFLIASVYENCTPSIQRFNKARKQLQSVTMEEIRVPEVFRCNVVCVQPLITLVRFCRRHAEQRVLHLREPPRNHPASVNSGLLEPSSVGHPVHREHGDRQEEPGEEGGIEE